MNGRWLPRGDGNVDGGVLLPLAVPLTVPLAMPLTVPLAVPLAVVSSVGRANKSVRSCAVACVGTRMGAGVGVVAAEPRLVCPLLEAGWRRAACFCSFATAAAAFTSYVRGEGCEGEGEGKSNKEG